MATVPPKHQQPLHNFSLPFLKWRQRTQINNNCRRRYRNFPLTDSVINNCRKPHRLHNRATKDEKKKVDEENEGVLVDGGDTTRKLKCFIVAGTVGLVDELKDQRFARWNNTIRTIHHHAKSNIRSLSYTKDLSESAAMASSRAMEEKAKQPEESLRKVIYLAVRVLIDK